MNRYQNIPKTKYDKKEAYISVKYPEISLSENDTYVYSSQGDRFDVLANKFYGDGSLWWIISIANTTLNQGSLLIPEGTQVRIPWDYISVLNKFNEMNSI